MKTKIELLEDLRIAHPDIAVSVSWEFDQYFTWDGDGPDPLDDGYEPHNVTVEASTIRNGEVITGYAYLGGCYADDEKCPEIHGYFPQMLEDALHELKTQVES